VYFLPLGYALTAHFAQGEHPTDWRTASRDSIGIAPDPVSTQEAIIQVYSAKAFRWRGAIGEHAWIAVKPQGATYYTRFEVMGFNVARGGDAVSVSRGTADGQWFGRDPALLHEMRGGDEVDALIERLFQAADDYPYNREYRIWPGPNSNTFIAWLGRTVPELSINLPPTAVGKDYLPGGAVFARAPSGHGVQVSLNGLLGIIVSPVEGLEVNVLGLTAGIDPWPAAVKLPGVGRVGMPVQQLPKKNGSNMTESDT